MKKYNEKYPEKRAATLKSQRMKPPLAGLVKHHWSYNEIHFKDVIWLRSADHAFVHRFIIYDQERRMYRRCEDNVLLDTKENHEKFIFRKMREHGEI